MYEGERHRPVFCHTPFPYVPTNWWYLSYLFPSVIGIRVSTLALELVLIGLTWYKTLSRWRTLKTIAPTPLTTMLLRDGTPSFAVRRSWTHIGASTGTIYFRYDEHPFIMLDIQPLQRDHHPLRHESQRDGIRLQFAICASHSLRCTSSHKLSFFPQNPGVTEFDVIMSDMVPLVDMCVHFRNMHPKLISPSFLETEQRRYACRVSSSASATSVQVLAMIA